MNKLPAEVVSIALRIRSLPLGQTLLTVTKTRDGISLCILAQGEKLEKQKRAEKEVVS